MFPILATIFVGLMLLWTLRRFHQGDISLLRTLGWCVIWIGVAVVSWRPELTHGVGRWLGVGRPVDLLFAVGILFLLYGMFSLYLRTETQRRQITELVRQQALRDAELTDSHDNTTDTPPKG